MRVLDRTIPPQRQIPTELPVPDLRRLTTGNGVELYLVEGGDQDLVSVALEIDAGSVHEEKPAVAAMCASMLTRGTKLRTADEIADETDFYGAHIQASAKKEATVVNLLTLNKHLEFLIPVLIDTVTSPVFPEDELKTLAQRAKNRLEIKLQHVRTRAARNFNAVLLGGTPWHTPVVPENYDALTSEHLAEFHATHYTPSRTKCFISGKNTQRAAEILMPFLEKWAPKKSGAPKTIGDQWEYRPREMCETDETASQSAIFVGFPVVTAHHPDYPAIYFLDKVLGGHFGSRLMRNLRVKNGFTYGANSYVTQHRNISFLTISTQVGTRHTSDAVNEIKAELNRLTQEPIPREEWDLVLHQIAGRLAMAMDGPFQRVNLVMNLLRRGLDLNHPSSLMARLSELQPDEVMHVARRHFDPSAIATSVVGLCP